MRIIRTTKEFYEIANPLIDWEFDGVDGLEADSIAGLFFSDRAAELKDFCERNPKYHIISIKASMLFNRFVEKASAFYLADGDSSPEIILIRWHETAEEKFMDEDLAG